MRIKQTIAPILFVILIGALLIQLPLAIAAKANDYEWIDPIVDIRRLLLDHFVHQPDDRKMQQAMIEAMVRSVDDPFTVYVSPEQEAEFNKSLRGTYVGIGAEVRIIDDYLTIVTPMDGSPALEAGIHAGDVVLEIEGISTYQKSVEECINLLMGEPHTPVTIRVRHLDGREETITVVRRSIQTRTVEGVQRDNERWSFCVDDELGLSYIRITQFNNNTLRELNSVLDSIQSQGLNGLILDLRDNPGGSLREALAMADLFLESGTILSVRGRDGEHLQTFHASAQGTLPNFPMIVLINGRSASASEIVAGALQDNGRARVLGARSFGKGSVQEVRRLPFNRGTLKYTSAHYFLPSDRNINRLPDSDVWGVDPDPGMVVTVPDEQYFRMLRARREFEIIRENGPGFVECIDSQWIRDNTGDEQFALSLQSLRHRVRSGEWLDVGAQSPALVALSSELDQQVERRARLMEQLQQTEQSIAQLQDAAAHVGRPPLLPADVDLTEGTLVLRDKFDNIIATYRIEGGNIALGLETMHLQPMDNDQE